MANSLEVGVLDPKDLEESLRKYFKDDTLKVTSIHTTPSTMKGENFTTKVDFLDVDVERGLAGNMTDSLKIFVKKAIKNGMFSMMLKETRIYEKEASFFNEVLPALRQVCVNSDLKLDFSPPCYIASDQVVAMENLVASKGCQMFPRSVTGQDMAHVEKALEALSTLHAASFALKRQWEDPQVHLPFLKDTMVTDKEGPSLIATLFLPCFTSVARLLEEEGKFSSAVDVLQKVGPCLDDIYRDTIKNEEPFNVICHADCWNNNMLFHYSPDDKEHKRPLKVTLVDFQVMRWAPLTADLLYYLFTSTSIQFRQKHMRQVLSFYYDNLSKSLRKVGIQQPPFTLDQLETKFSQNRLFGLISGIGILTANLTPKEIMPDFVEELGEMPDMEEEFLKIMKKASKACKDGSAPCDILAQFAEDFKADMQIYFGRKGD